MNSSTVSNYSKYVKFLKKYVERDGIDDFLYWLGTTDAVTAPASSRYHLSCEGGFIKHSLNVMTNLGKVAKMMYPNDTCPYSKDTLAFVALLHDISKVNFYELSYRNKQDPNTGKWEKVPYYSVIPNENRFDYGNHEETSVYILSQFFKLSYEETLAIRFHSGLYGPNDDNNSSACLNAYKRSPLALMLNMADMMSICVDEVEEHGDVCGFFTVERGTEEFNENGELENERDTDTAGSEVERYKV